MILRNNQLSLRMHRNLSGTLVTVFLKISSFLLKIISKDKVTYQITNHIFSLFQVTLHFRDQYFPKICRNLFSQIKQFRPLFDPFSHVVLYKFIFVVILIFNTLFFSNISRVIYQKLINYGMKQGTNFLYTCLFQRITLYIKGSRNGQKLHSEIANACTHFYTQPYTYQQAMVVKW